MKRTLLTLSLLSASAMALSLSGQVVETFNYTTTTDLGSPAVTGTGQQGNWGNFWFGNSVSGSSDASIQSGSLTAPTGYGFTPTNNRLGYDEGGNLDAAAYFEFANTEKIDFNADGTYYMSFLIRAFDNGSTRAQFDFQTDTGSSIFVIGETTAGAGELSVNGVLSSAKMDTNGTNAIGMDNLVILKIDTLAAGNDTLSASFWTSGVDTLGSEPVTWDVTSNITSSSLAAGFRIDISDGFGNLDASLDEIRIGSSFGAVAVPEPSTYALLAGMLALGAVMIRRRR